MNPKSNHPRNSSLFDKWSLVHISSGIVAAVLMPPLLAIIILALWEPLEIFVLSPFMARFGIIFGHESLKNSLADIFFNIIGVIIGILILSNLNMLPLFLFGQS